MAKCFFCVVSTALFSRKPPGLFLIHFIEEQILLGCNKDIVQLRKLPQSEFQGQHYFFFFFCLADSHSGESNSPIMLGGPRSLSTTTYAFGIRSSSSYRRFVCHELESLRDESIKVDNLRQIQSMSISAGG